MPDFGFSQQQEVRAPATVAAARWTQSQGGTWGIEFDFEFASPERNWLGNGMAGIDATVWLTPKTANMAHKQLKVLGFDSDLADEAQVRLFKKEPGTLFTRKPCLLVCRLEEPNEYHDQALWKVAFINAEGGEGGEPSFDPVALLRSRERAAKKPKKTGPVEIPLLPADTTPAEYDEDVPF